MEYSVNEKQIQRDLKNLIDMGGLHKGYAKMAAKAAATVVDDAARKGYKREYTRGSRGKGSSDTHIYGNMLTRVSRKIYIARPSMAKLGIEEVESALGSEEAEQERVLVPFHDPQVSRRSRQPFDAFASDRGRREALSQWSEELCPRDQA